MTDEPFPATVYPAWRFIDLFLIALLTFGLLVVGSGGLAWLLNPSEGEITLALVFSGIFIQSLSFLLGMVCIGIYRQVAWHKMGWGYISVQWWLVSVCLGFAILPIMGIIGLGIQTFWQNEWTNPQTQFLIPEGFSWLAMVGMILGVGILAPIAEEGLFRGVLFYWLRQNTPFWVAALVSSLLFGLIHADPLISTSTAVLGFLCAWAYEKSGSIWGAITIHAVNNSLVVIISYLALWMMPNA